MTIRRTGLALLLVAVAAACGSSSSGGGTPTGSTTSSAAYVTKARWHPDDPGFQIRVTASGYGRRHSALNATTALNAALAAAGTAPLTLTATMHESLMNQLKCHAVFAPLKPQWDLETFRPNVGYARTVLHHCNP